MSMLIKNIDAIVTVDQKRRILKNNSIAIEGDRIVEIGPLDILKKNYSNVEKEIDGKGTVAFPGFINSHAHLSQTIFRGLVDDKPLIEWLKPIFLLRREATSEEIVLSTALGCLEMIKNGITTVATLQAFRYIDDAVSKIEELGIRCVVARISTDYREVETTPVESVERCVRESEAFIRRWHNSASGRIRVMLGPLGLPASSLELFRHMKELSKKYNVGIHTHVGENKKTFNMLKKEQGKGEIGVLFDLGILGPNVVLAHCILVSEKDLKLLSKTKTNVVHCPCSNMKLATGIAPVPKMIKSGINVALGTDGAPSNNRLDMITEMKHAALLHKVAMLSPDVTPATQVLEMATINGAKALGLESEIGSLEKGKKADLILVDFKKPHLLPNWNPISHLVYAATGCDVESVICNGQLLMKNRKMITIDEESLLERIPKLGESILKHFPELKRYVEV